MTSTMMRPRRCPRCRTEPRPALFFETDTVGGGDWVCVSGHRFSVNTPLPLVNGHGERGRGGKRRQ